MIEVGNIVCNLIPQESVTITKIQKLGNSYAVHYIGVISHKHSTKVLTAEQLKSLEIVTEEGHFNFRGDPEKFILFAESERITSAYQFDPLFAINCSVVDPLPHQVEAVYKFLLPQPTIRFLLADDTGAGKTIMTGLLLKELIMRKRVERILIVTPGGLTKQWQEDELGIKFNIPFTLVNRASFISEPTIFQTHDKIVSSIDFICRDDIMQVLSKTHWDLVIFDEAHKLSAYEYGAKTYKSRRYEAAYQLSKQCEHLLLLTATPHRGRPDTFKRLLQLLDNDIFATADVAADRVKELSQDGVNKFFIRRLKEDMKDWNGQPLYKKRSTKTVSYQLTSEEKRLYEAVTDYLTTRKEEAAVTKNIHVSLALQVMQRRLTSSIYAIKNTLERRWKALQGLADELARNPSIWKQRQKIEELDANDMDSYDDLDDEQREALDNIMTDPKKLKLFTTAKSPSEVMKEAQQVKELYLMASNLYNRNQEEKKYIELKELLNTQGVINGEKLVVFTEHKDTLIYLQEKLMNNGYSVAVIHGGMSVDERRESQCAFMSSTAQILIATDAAGEGINLQFCRLLINWDIPWNPNRLEQRMGRIHRYGQNSDVLVFNMVAENTREGQVMSTLLKKLDIIREGLGDDRVYDVIQDVLKGISLDAIISSVFDGRESDLDAFISKEGNEIQDLFKRKIEEQNRIIAHSQIDFKDAIRLKEESDEKRLQPIYIRLFFERAFKYLGGEYEEIEDGIFRVLNIPHILADRLKSRYHIYTDNLKNTLFCFDKHIFLDYQHQNSLSGRAHYINPGNPLFDSLLEVVRDEFRVEMLKGTVLVSPEDSYPYMAFFIKNQITDNRSSKSDDNIANELLSLVYQTEDKQYHITSPAKFLDLVPPAEFAKKINPPSIECEDDVLEWSFNNITIPLLEQTNKTVQEDVQQRKQYIQTAFTNILLDLDSEINELQGKVFMSDAEKIQQTLEIKMLRREEIVKRREERLREFEYQVELSPKTPEVMGCAYVVPLNQVEYHSAFGMSRDDEVEAIGMRIAFEYEQSQGRTPIDVSKQNVGYDLRSSDIHGTKRYIEVKGRAGLDGAMLSENEMNRLSQLGSKAWLYLVVNCKTTPELKVFQDPAHNLEFKKLVKGVQYFLSLDEWQSKHIHN